MMTVKGLEEANKHIKQRSVSNGGGKISAMFWRGVRARLRLGKGVVDYMY